MFSFHTLSLFSLSIASAVTIVQSGHSTGQDVELLDSYDFVVIGGGTSGLTVADRLTEDPASV